MAIHELCGFCGDRVADCIDAGECNYGIAGEVIEDNCTFCRGTCKCDDLYSNYKEQEASDYYDSV
jgi:hypothetical protein